MSTVWYTAPDQPLSPAPGDLVHTEAYPGTLDHWEVKNFIAGASGSVTIQWSAVCRRASCLAFKAHRVRRPTQAELAAHRLSQGES